MRVEMGFCSPTIKIDGENFAKCLVGGTRIAGQQITEYDVGNRDSFCKLAERLLAARRSVCEILALLRLDRSIS